MIVYKVGDVLGCSEQVLLHGVNCKGAFGAGVALQIGLKYPKVRDAYLKRHRSSGWRLGDLQGVRVSSSESPLWVVNAATQLNYGRGECHVNYDAVRTCVSKTLDWCTKQGYLLAMPMIGAGLAGGSWEVIENILLDVSKDVNIYVYRREVK